MMGRSRMRVTELRLVGEIFELTPMHYGSAGASPSRTSSTALM